MGGSLRGDISLVASGTQGHRAAYKLPTMACPTGPPTMIAPGPATRQGTWGTTRGRPEAAPRFSNVLRGQLADPVLQLASDVRVPPHEPIAPVRYCSRVQVCAIYSEAIQSELPSVTAAP